MNKFKKYLDDIGSTPTKFSADHKCSLMTTCRAYNGKVLSPKNARIYSGYTGGIVSELDFLYPGDFSKSAQAA